MGTAAVSAVILAAGEGRRLEPLTNRRPKPMVPVANRPLLEHVLEAVVAAGIDHVVFVVGYRQERIRNHFGDGDAWGIDVEYVEQSTQLGTGHAVLQAEPAVNGPFVVVNGDRIVDPSIVTTVCDRAASGETPTVAVTRVDNPQAYGVVSLEGDRVVAIDEKPDVPVETGRINAGVYGFSPAIFEAIRETTTAGELTITATLNDVASAAGVYAVSYDGRWLDVSNLWDLLAVNAALIGADEAAGESTVGEAVASETTGANADSVSVADDAVLADTVRVGPNVTLGGATAIGRNATVEAGAVVENAVVFPDAVIGAGAVVRGAIVAGNARIGPNATVAGEPATVVVGDAVHHDVALSGVVGDNATIGAGATLTDGAVVGDDVAAEAGVVVDGRVAPGAVVRRG
ncbi:sugar phosphate nucleotidyltransferase [Halorubrum sp. SY-15]|uniref:sugar phosphate nucleotidyltransferase n=1 Tax=Halorubrum sp. SY-15 TaxID=3402277 RepID=UPI003EC009D9